MFLKKLVNSHSKFHLVSIATTGGNSNRYDFNLSKHRHWSLFSVGQYNIWFPLIILCPPLANHLKCINQVSNHRNVKFDFWLYRFIRFGDMRLDFPGGITFYLTTGGNSNRYDFNLSKHRHWSLFSVGQYNDIIIKPLWSFIKENWLIKYIS
jgi:hypothetical protein